MANHVYGASEFKASSIFSADAKNNIVSYEDLCVNIERYYEIDPQFSLFLTLLLITAQRNATIRTLKFNAFSKEHGKYILRTHASKTNKKMAYFISADLYNGVMKMREKRLEECEGKLRYLKKDSKEFALCERRKEHVFTFFTSSATWSRFYEFRKMLKIKDVKHAKTFVIHDIRRIALRHEADIGGDEAAKDLAQHSDMKMTKHYLGSKPVERRIFAGIDFKSLADNLNSRSLRDDVVEHAREEDDEEEEDIPSQAEDSEDIQ